MPTLTNRKGAFATTSIASLFGRRPSRIGQNAPGERRSRPCDQARLTTPLIYQPICGTAALYMNAISERPLPLPYRQPLSHGHS